MVNGVHLYQFDAIIFRVTLQSIQNWVLSHQISAHRTCGVIALLPNLDVN